MAGEFTLSSEVRDTVLILKTEGYLNNIGGERIVDEISKQNYGTLNRVIIDLEKSNVVNSIGISYLIEAIEILNENNSKLIFANLDPSIEKTFKIMGIFQFAEKAENLEAALNS